MAKSAVESREVDELAERMLRVLESQQRLGGDAYPPTLARLAELSGVNASSTNVTKAVGKKSFKERAVVAWNKDRKPSREAPVLLTTSGDLDPAVAETAPALLIALLNGASEKSPAQSIADLAKKLTERVKKPFQAAIKDRIESRSLPAEVGWLPNKGSKLLFLLSAVQTSGPRSSFGAQPPRAQAGQAPSIARAADVPSNGGLEFAPAFRTAFDRLDRDNRATNFVRLLDLRRALPRFDRERFDQGLRQLRLDDEFTLSGHEGRLGPLTDEEREAGVREVGSLLVYVSRRG